MKSIIQKLIVLILLLPSMGLLAQESQQGNSFSLQQAIDYALKNSPNALNADNEIIAARYDKKAIAGTGLPQLSAGFNLQNFIKIPVSVLPNFIAPSVYQGINQGINAIGPTLSSTFVPIPTDPALLDVNNYPAIAAQFGQKYQASATASLTQILFNSDYIVGLQAAGYLESIATINASRTRIDLVAAVSKAYYGVLVNTARMSALESNISRLTKNYNDLKAYNQQGLVEAIDVERLEVALNNLQTEKQNVDRLMFISDAALRFQMGYMGNEKLNLTDKLPTDLNEQEMSAAATEYNNRPEFLLTKSQYELNTLNLKKEKLGYLPMLNLFASGGYNGFSKKFDLFSKSASWYPNLVIGAGINWRLFDGLQRHNRIQRVKIDISKSQQSMKQVQMMVDLDATSSMITLNNAIASLKSQSRNMDLAKHVSQVAQEKYTQGVGSNLEVVTAESSLRESEANYFNAVYNLLVAKIDYQKARGTLAK